MANTLVNQGILNRLLTAVNWSLFPALNVTAPYLGKEMVVLTFEGETTVYINTVTGAVTSQEPYVKVSFEMALLKSQNLAQQYKTQIETNTLLGECTVFTDSPALNPYTFSDCSIQNVRALRLTGDDASFGVTIGGIYYLNSNLFSVL